ncbi:AraC-like DNA-binding protein [Deinococcus sp. HSC-46F16]|uniref:helix-turn-helix domain-containing protein n=1 Tax=Deinococcus sp. HSC-46F16 TaxID=2910968 RepID=UPI00209F92F5|nr:AraC-like DNA-binding protein [Deinococcus sp. HSC-46F16]
MTPPVRVQSWRAPELGGVDFLHGSFTTHAFARHTHDTYSIGLLAQGAMTFECRGATHTLRPGFIGLIHPDEVHTGHAETRDGWTYRNFYPDAGLLRGAFMPSGSRADRLPRLPVVIHDPVLFHALVTAYRAFEEHAPSLAREALMREALTDLVLRHALRPPTLPTAGQEPRALHLVRTVLEDDFARNVTLDELARLAGLNPYTLLRAFRRAHGLPPHAYQLQVRLRHAKRFLRGGETVAQAALRAGFADQSHFGRHFRRTFGVTPGQYRQGVKNVLAP